MSPPVSLCMIVRDSAETLERCLESVADLVSEIVVVDTGSADSSMAIATRYGASVFSFQWTDDFSAARNESMRHASQKWILWLDSDDFLDRTNRERLVNLFASLRDQKVAYTMTVRSHRERDIAAECVCHVRLFPNLPGAKWRYRIHEQVLPFLADAGVEVRASDVTVEHTGYTDSRLLLSKTMRNLRLARLDALDYPDDPFVLFNAGIAYLVAGNPTEAIGFLEQSRRAPEGFSPIPGELYSALTDAFLQVGNTAAAIAACHEGLVETPLDMRLLYYYGELRRLEGDAAGAEAAWKRAVDLVDNDEHAHSQLSSQFGSRDEALVGMVREKLGALLLDQGRMDHAEACWRRGAETVGSIGCLVALGNLLLFQRRFKDMRALTEQLQSLGKAGRFEACLMRGQQSAIEGDFDGMRRIAESLIKCEPNSFRANFLYAQSLLRQSNNAEAIERAMRRVLILNPKFKEGWCNLIGVLRRSGRLEDAISACLEGLQARPNDPDLRMMMGVALLEANRLSEAEATLAGLAAANADAATTMAHACVLEARDKLAIVYLRQGRVQDAAKEWQAVIRVNPSAVTALIGLGQIALDDAKFDEVEAIATQLAGLFKSSDREEVVWLRANLSLRRREFAQARALLERALIAAPTSRRMLRLLSYALLQEGKDLWTAEIALRRLLTVCPNDAEAKHNLNVLLRSPEVGESQKLDRK